MRSAFIAYFSAILVFGVLVGTGLVLEWGRWYAEHQGYRLQTNAFLEGRVALADNPAEIDWDQAWARGKVQQVWGLGAPAWRLPFEFGAGMIGQPAFPDRFALAVAMVLVFYAVIALMAVPVIRRRPDDTTGSKASANPGGMNLRGILTGNPEGIVGALILVLFPPFLSLCSYRFWVYEEAVAYGYLAGIGLFLGTLVFVRRPRFWGFLLLCLFAGLAPFVRPTLAFYSIVSVMTVGAYVVWIRWPSWRLGLGLFVFACGGLMVFGSNVHRFGSGLEFGHRLNLHTVDTMGFASRFEAPYTSEPVLSASRDLGASLFVAGNRFNGYDWFEEDFFPGQSSTHRWREYYFRTYDLSYALMLLVLWGGGLWWLVAGRPGVAGVRGIKNGRNPGRLTVFGRFLSAAKARLDELRVSEGKELRASAGGGEVDKRIELSVMLVWSVVPALALFVLYLRTPFITSRYFLDFGPAFAVGLAGAVMLAAMGLRALIKSEARVAAGLFVAFGLWWGWQVVATSGAEEVAAARNVISREELPGAGNSISSADRPVHESNGYRVGDSPEDGWPWLHLTGWDLRTGDARSLVKLFVPSVDQLTLEVGPAEGVTLEPEDYEIIRAKIGLEFLERIGMRETAEGMEIVFDGPRSRRYRNGMQICFLGFMSAETLIDANSKFRLLGIEWEENRAEAQRR